MTDYILLERDFITRTRSLIAQYDACMQSPGAPDESYEVTLLLNCLLGLLIFPQQIAAQNRDGRGWSQWLSRDKVADVGPDWGILPQYVIRPGHKRTNKDNGSDFVRITFQELTLRNLVRQMRNTAAHARFDVEGSHDGNIHILRFEDVEKEEGFCLELPVESLRIFVDKLTESALAKINKPTKPTGKSHG